MKDLLTKANVSVPLVEEALAPTVKQLADVAKAGAELSEGVEFVYLVSSGGGLHIDTGISWWCKTFFGQKANIRYETYDASVFLSLPMIDTAGPSTLVMLTSKSGSTAEALAVGARLEKVGNGCKVVCFTGRKEAAIVKYGRNSFFTGDTPQSFHAMLMLHHAFMAGIWHARENWGLRDTLLSSLAALPAALANAALVSQSRCKKFADDYSPSGIIYFIAAGPMEFVGCAFGNCLMEEMLETNVKVFPSYHFYHSLVEKMPVDKNCRVILLPGLDSTRWLTNRLINWFKEKDFSAEVYDAEVYDMKGIDEQIQPMLAPIIVEAALKPMAVPLSEKTKDLQQRKYMGKEKFWKGCEVVTENPAI